MTAISPLFPRQAGKTGDGEVWLREEPPPDSLGPEPVQKGCRPLPSADKKPPPVQSLLPRHKPVAPCSQPTDNPPRLRGGLVDLARLLYRRQQEQTPELADRILKEPMIRGAAQNKP